MNDCVKWNNTVEQEMQGKKIPGKQHPTAA